jgi:hydrophobic/amphiphilic exporter-1 (mainly G- bacteria), HAE1 family
VKGLAAKTVRRPVATIMVAVGVFLFGLLSLREVPLDLLPDLSYPAITIEVPFAGASPQEVESLVVRPVEDAVSVSGGLVRMRSTCLAGRGRLSLHFRWGTRMDVAALEVREKLQQVQLPEGASAPQVLRFDPGLEPILRVGLRPKQEQAGQDARERNQAGLIALRRLAEERLKPALERLEGVAAARVRGGLEEEVRVFVDPRAAALAGVTLDEISSRLASESVNLAGGTLREGKLEYRVRTLNELRDLEGLRRMVVAQRPEGTIRLGQVALVELGPAEREVITRLDGSEAIELSVFKASGKNTVAVAEATLARLKAQTRPGGLLQDARYVVTSDQSAFIRSSLEDLGSTAWTGGILAVLVLLLFLGDLRSTLTVAFAIPLSLVATFLLMRAAGVSLNVMSLSGIALAIGMLVDNAIVVLEAIAAARERGEGDAEGTAPAGDAPVTPESGEATDAMSPEAEREAADEAQAQAAIQGTDAVAQAVVASTLTTLSVFLPVAFVEGIASRLFADQAYTIVFALGASLVASLSVIPMLAATRTGEGFLLWAGRVVHVLLTPLRVPYELAWGWLSGLYPRALSAALAGPRKVLAGAALATGLALLLGGSLGADFLPDMHPGLVRLELSLPRGASLIQTDQTLTRLSAGAREIEDVEAVFATAGALSRAGEPDELRESVGQLLVRLRPGAGAAGEERVIEALRAEVAEEPGLLAPVFQRPGLVQVRSPLEVMVEGRELDALQAGAEVVLERLRKIPGLTDLRSSARGGRPEIRVSLDRRRLAQYELDAGSVSAALEIAVRGRVGADLVRSDREVPIRVSLEPGSRQTVADLERVVVSPAGRTPILLRSVGRVEVERGPAEIRREGQRRVAVVQAEVKGRDLGSAAAEIEEALAGLDLPPGTFAHTGGSAEELSEAFRGLGFAIVLAVLLVYLILAAQFESFVLPLIVLGAIPLAAASATFGLWLSGTSLSVVVLIGVVVLAGIVVNNAILLVDRIQQLRAAGSESGPAIVQAGRDRLRPIVMTTATTVLGLLPLVVFGGDGAELRAPLAMTLISGLLGSTVLTLVVVPCAYRVLARGGREGECTA